MMLSWNPSGKNGICFPLLVLSLSCVTPGRAVPARSAATARINPSETHQTIEGFGASAFYYDNWLTAHPNKEKIYNYIFEELGLDILRLGNVYDYQGGSFAPTSMEIVQKAEKYLGSPVKVMISSWSPPAYLKSNNSTKNGGTLFKENGAYAYGKYAQYWVQSLAAYQKIGIIPEYISIQNEPDWVASYESCMLRETETAVYAGYDKALDAVYDSLQALESHPKIIGPEVLGIGYNNFQKYGQRLNRGKLDGYAYHLYHGESDNVNDNHNPDLFITNLSAVANAYKDKPIFQTEYDRGDWFNTAWLMHNALVHGNVSAYLYWGLFWDVQSGSPLVALENPWNRSGWKTSEGYRMTDAYYAFRQFSKFTDPGWKRITATVDSNPLKISAYLSADGDSLTAVALNVSQTSVPLSLDLGGYSVSSGRMIRTSQTEKDADTGPYDAAIPIDLPGRSITTIVLRGSPSSVKVEEALPLGFFLESNYPNPFNPQTTIRFGLARRTDAVLTFTDLTGRTVRELRLGLLPAGPHRVRFDATGLPAGVYLYRLETEDGTSAARKMILSK